MQELLKSEVFFFITSVAVVILTILAAILIAYLIKIFRDIKYISQKAKTETDNLSKDLAALRASVSENNSKFKALFSFFSIFAKKAGGKKGKNND